MSFTIYHSLIINASTKQVFDAISLPKQLNNWWTLKCTGNPILNAEYNLNFTDTYNWYGKVSSCISDKSFHIYMTKSDHDWDATTFGLELEEVDKGTLLKFSHENWQELNHNFKHSSFCWAMLLNGLKNYLENGIIIPFEKRN